MYRAVLISRRQTGKQVTMSLQEKLNALNHRLQKILKPGIEEVLEKHISSQRTNGFLEGVLKPGAMAPTFNLQNQHGQMISSSDLLSQGVLVIGFSRGGWCPFCVEEANAFNAIYERFQELGAQLVILTPQSLAGIKDWVQHTPYKFNILRDEGNKIGDAFGVVYTFPEDLNQLYQTAFAKDIPVLNDSAGWKLPVPARFILDQGGVIRDAEADPNYRSRPEPEDTLSLVAGLAAVAR